MDQLITLVLFAGVPAGFLAAAHFAFQEREIEPPLTYVIGVSTIQGALILWMLYAGIDPLAIAAVVIITAFIGGTILICYLIDRAKRGDRAGAYGQSRRPD